MVYNIIIAIIAYLIGSINFSVIISKKMAGFDVREKGSGNAGTTNMLRSVGKKGAAITLICDILKGVVAILIAMFIGWAFKVENQSLLVYWKNPVQRSFYSSLKLLPIASLTEA